MRLISTSTLELVDVWDDDIPSYAILSHRWTDEEVTLAEYLQASEATKAKSGWQKIASCATQSVKDGHDYLWIDTCCIDKTSSAELSEAINSMYRWYKESAVCYTYLNDVDLDTAFVKDSDGQTSFESSRIHSRGWCLQELLAPATVRFFTRDWKELGSKADPKLRERLSKATGIGVDVLSGATPLEVTSIARRMSWASRRQTTRIEDMAYCLLGIFDVNMPMLYGEGLKAFRRLQEEIMKSSKDQTLFAWIHTEYDPIYGGLLAPHPRNFRDSAKFEDKSAVMESRVHEHETTRDGIWLNVYVIEHQPKDIAKAGITGEAEDQFFTATLRCTECDDANRFAAIRLVKHGSDYMRYKETTLRRARLAGKQNNILIRHKPTPQAINRVTTEYIRVAFESNCPRAYAIPVPRAKWASNPLFRSKALRKAAVQILATWPDKDLESANVVEQEDQPKLYKGEVPLRQLEYGIRGTEKFWPSTYETGFDAELKDLRWIVPMLPDKPIAYLRIVLGPGLDPYETHVSTNASGHLCFEANNNGGSTDPTSFKKGYVLHFRRNNFDRATSVGEIAEVVIGLQHRLEEGPMAKTWRPKGQECSCVEIETKSG